MSVYSMTGFGRGESIGTNFTVTTEIKTVNNRFKDIRFKMSSLFNSLEIDLKGILENSCKRGTFDISINYKRNDQKNLDFAIDSNKIQAYLSLISPVLEKSKWPVQVSPTEFLRSDFSKDDDIEKQNELLPLVKKSFEAAIKNLQVSRSQEGQKLVGKLLEHLKHYEEGLGKIEVLKKEYPDMVKERLTSKLNERLKEIKVDESRFLQEVVYYLEKLEIDEEINRAKIHLEKLRKLMQAGGELGRQIDFLLQELGRETNTIGSKSSHMEISSQVVEMKVQLEKIREQALNLE